MTHSQHGEEIGELVPFPLTRLAPAIIVPADAQPGSQVVKPNPDDQLRQLVTVMLAGPPARWQDRDHLGQVGTDLVRHTLRVPFRYPDGHGSSSSELRPTPHSIANDGGLMTWNMIEAGNVVSGSCTVGRAIVRFRERGDPASFNSVSHGRNYPVTA